MKIGTNYTKVVSEVSKVNKTSIYKQEEKKVDYSNYTIEQMRKLPYEEVKKNHSDIVKAMESMPNEEINKPEWDALLFQIGNVKRSDNDQFNKALFNSYKNFDDASGGILSVEIQTNLQDYYHGKSINASFVASNDEIHTSKNLTKSQINSIDFNDFISKMISTFTEDLNESKGSVKDQYSNIVTFYNSLQDNYNKTVREHYYA